MQKAKTRAGLMADLLIQGVGLPQQNSDVKAKAPKEGKKQASGGKGKKAS